MCVCARARARVRPQVSLVLSALQAGNKGTQACITAASAVSGIIADLDTTIMFASAGTLNAENNESFADHRWVGVCVCVCMCVCGLGMRVCVVRRRVS